MVKGDKKKSTATDTTRSKKRKISDIGVNGDKKKSDGGIDEFDKLFSEKKKLDQQTKQEEENREAAKKAARKARYKNDGASSSNCKKIHSTDVDRTEWVDDGLGGIYNKEGYTGRIEDGVKIFKRHILNKPGAGDTKDCPFDCNCCFI
jgi:hypothetical protein